MSESETAKETARETELPPDVTDEERTHFEMTGTLDLYEAHREGERLNKERSALLNEETERVRLRTHLSEVQFQNAQRREEVEELRARAQEELPPRVEPEAIEGSEKLPESAKRVLRRLFINSIWSIENQKSLVQNILLEMDDMGLRLWAMHMETALAAGVYSPDELSPVQILKGSTGLKKLAGGVMGDGPSMLDDGSEAEQDTPLDPDVLKTTRIEPEDVEVVDDEDEIVLDREPGSEVPVEGNTLDDGAGEVVWDDPY